MTDIIPTEAQRHRENIEKAEEFFERNPTLQSFRRKIKIIAGETPLDEMIEHAEKLMAAGKFFMKDLEDCREAFCNVQEEVDMHNAAK